MTNNSFDDELIELEKKGLRRRLLDPHSFRGINFSSNDYLGLSHDPGVKLAAARAIEHFGTGGTSSRLLAGTFPPHQELEAELARFFEKESALVFSSGYHLNSGLYAAISGSGDIVFADRYAHASILDGLKLSDGRFATFRHNDLEDLESLLKARRSNYRRAYVVTEGTFSMDGDHPPISELVDLAHRYDAHVVIDEAHSIGVTGPDGRGWSAANGVLSEIDIFVGTLSKALGSQGGFVVGSAALRDLLISRCRSFLFTTSLAPAAAAAGLAALKLFPGLEEERQHLKKVSRNIRSELTQAGYESPPGDSPIVPVFVGEVEPSRQLADHLFSQGFFVPSIRPPTVPLGTCRVRLSLTIPAVKLGWDGLLQAFREYSTRPRRTSSHIGQPR